MREKPYRRLRIIMDQDKSVIEDHARMLYKALAENEKKMPGHAKPRGIASHVAQHPILCTDCNQTYWSRDEYAAHGGCKGAPPKQTAGFF